MKKAHTIIIISNSAAPRAARNVYISEIQVKVCSGYERIREAEFVNW